MDEKPVENTQPQEPVAVPQEQPVVPPVAQAQTTPTMSKVNATAEKTGASKFTVWAAIIILILAAFGGVALFIRSTILTELDTVETESDTTSVFENPYSETKESTETTTVTKQEVETQDMDTISEDIDQTDLDSLDAEFEDDLQDLDL